MRSAAAPTLLLGAQRSGTTALATVLDEAFLAAGGVFTINGKLPYVLHRWCTDADLAARHLRVDEMLHALARRPPYGAHRDRWCAVTEKVLREAAAQVAAGEVTDARALRRDVVRRAYDWGTRFGDKYNEYLLELDELDHTVPDAHWVLLIRHPAAVAESMLRWSGDRPWRPATVDDALRKWAAWHEPYLRSARAGDAGSCTVIEYEDLCDGPGVRVLSQAIDLDLAPHVGGLAYRPGPVVDLPPDVDAVWRALLEHRS